MKTRKRGEKLTKKGIKLLRWVQKKIAENPTSFDIGLLVARKRYGQVETTVGDLTDELVPPCGTVACVAGWININAGDSRAGILEASKRLGFKEGALASTNELFFAHKWPDSVREKDRGLISDLRDAFLDNDREEIKRLIAARGKLASRRIDAFIKKYS